MKNATTADRLKFVMRERNLRQVDIIEKCKPYCIQYNVKLGRNDLSQYLSGKVQPGQSKLTVLGLALGVSEVWLMGYDVARDRKVEEVDPFSFDNVYKLEKRRIPLLGTVSCGEPIFADEDRESYVDIGTNIRADFCLKCKGDSMIGARIQDGDIVFVRKQPSVDNGDIAVVIIENEATLKRVFYYPEKAKLVLQAENPKYEPFVYVNEELNEITILGKAIAFQSDIF